MSINKKIIYSTLVLIIIIVAVFINLNKNKMINTENFDLSTIVDNSWEKRDSDYTFWFPIKNIVVVKTVNSFYQKNNEQGLIVKDIKNYSEKLLNDSIVQKLTSLGFSLDKDTSGLFGKLDFNPYYLLNFQKNNTWCQIEHLFEFTNKPNEFTDNGYSFSCFDFNLEKSYSQQNYFYQLLSEDLRSKDYNESINSVQKNSNGFTKIITNTKFDSNIFILDKNYKIICQGKPCCDENSQDYKELWNDDWCLNYQKPSY